MNKADQLNNLDDIMIDIMMQQYKQCGIGLPKVNDDFNQMNTCDNLNEVIMPEREAKSKKSIWGICSDFLTVATLSGSVACVIMYERQPIVQFDESVTHYVCGNNVNIREGSSIETPIIGQLDAGMGIKVIGSDRNWAVVEWENQSAYISYSYLQPIEKQACLRRYERALP